MTPRQVIEIWVHAFNQADIETLESLYADDAINHQMPNLPVTGKKAIGQMFRHEFTVAPHMHCIPVQIIEDGNWAALEWRDPMNFCGCGFFKVMNGLIYIQRGYWDKLTFNRLYHIKT